jgi:hypothetical protein
MKLWRERGGYCAEDSPVPTATRFPPPPRCLVVSGLGGHEERCVRARKVIEHAQHLSAHAHTSLRRGVARVCTGVRVRSLVYLHVSASDTVSVSAQADVESLPFPPSSPIFGSAGVEWCLSFCGVYTAVSLAFSVVERLCLLNGGVTNARLTRPGLQPCCSIFRVTNATSASMDSNTV